MKENQGDLLLGSKDPKSTIEGGYSFMNNEQLYKDIKSYVQKYLDANRYETGLIVIYSTATHVYMNYRVFPPFHITGDFETGKNRRLDLICGLCYKPTLYTNPTIATLFRTTEEINGTILIDEADSIIENSDVKNFLLSGYQVGAGIPRMVQDPKHPKGYRPEEFDIYGPKVLVTREGTEDEALNSRFITIITLPLSADSSVPHTMTEKDIRDAGELKQRIELMVSSLGEINSEDIELGLKGRDAQLFKPLKDIAYVYGEEAITDLKHFIDKEFIPDSKYDTMLSIQQDMIIILDAIWTNDNVAHLTTIASQLESDSSDYRNVGSKKVSKVLRSLGFKTNERDKKGHYVSPNSTLMSLLKVKYQVEDNSSADGVGSADVSEIGRPIHVPSAEIVLATDIAH